MLAFDCYEFADYEVTAAGALINFFKGLGWGAGARCYFFRALICMLYTWCGKKFSSFGVFGGCASRSEQLGERIFDGELSYKSRALFRFSYLISSSFDGSFGDASDCCFLRWVLGSWDGVPRWQHDYDFWKGFMSWAHEGSRLLCWCSSRGLRGHIDIGWCRAVVVVVVVVVMYGWGG